MTALRRLPWPLLAILTVQVALSFRLLHADSAFGDEALYLYSGHQMLAHWLHGSVVQDYPLYFSGSPAVYPPLGALADSLGGLLAARLLGLGFVLGATILLYRTTKTLFGAPEATLATALFASLAGTQFLSAFATYDPMALFLLAAAATLAVGRPYDESLAANIRLFIASPVLLVLANATKYATALYDPVVIALAALAPALQGAHHVNAWKAAIRYASCVAVIMGAALLLAGPKYWTGIAYTTVARGSRQPGMGQPSGLVLHLAWQWVGVVVVLAVIGVAVAGLRHKLGPVTLLAATLAVAVTLAPLNQARIGTTVSLHKHVVFGAWFGVIVAAHALWPVVRAHRWRATVLATAGLAILIGFTATQASALVDWPHENPAFITALAGVVHPGTDRYLLEDHSAIPAYYVGDVSSLQWKEAASYTYTDPATGQSLTGNAALTDAVRHRAFAEIILDGAEPQDGVVTAAIREFRDYTPIAQLPPDTLGSGAPYTVWQLDPSPLHAGGTP
jgi:hypothetical protein